MTTRVMFIFTGATHYYNLVLSKLNSIPGITIIDVIPREQKLDPGVYSTKTGINFRLVEAEQTVAHYGGLAFNSLWWIILKHRPHVVVTTDSHLLQFMREFRVSLVMRLLRIPLILKSIPFGVRRYDELRTELEKELAVRLAKPSPRCGSLLKALAKCGYAGSGAARVITGAIDTARRIKGRFKIGAILGNCKRRWRFPRAHVNYVPEAYDIYGGYGVPREKIFITYNSPDTDALLGVREELLKCGLSVQKHPHRIIHVGRLVEWKRVDLLLSAVASLNRKFNDLELLVIGYGPMEKQWKDMAAALGIDYRVRFLGGVYDPKELGRHFMSSAVYVLAGMGGLSINDAMCFGLPVVCSVGDGTEKYLVRDGVNGFVFKEGDASDLASKIALVIGDPDMCARMGEHSLRIIMNEINIHTVIRGYLKAFEYVTDRRLDWALA